MKIASLALLFALFSLGYALPTIISRPSMTNVEPFPTIYEISTRPWLYELSQKYGKQMKLADVPDAELDSFPKEIDAVWLMGVWSLGNYGLEIDKTRDYSAVLPGYTVDDVIGSPYAITEYIVNPVIGDDADVVQFRERLNARGLKLYLDFVPNHSAVDSPWIAQDMAQFIRAPQGTNPPYDPSYYLSNGVAMGRDPYFGAWIDTAQLNYWNSALRTRMLNVLLKIGGMADGVRCDMAMLLVNSVISSIWGKNQASWGYTAPREFWEEAIPQVKAQHPDFVFVAEVYDWDLCGGSCVDKVQHWFDYTYEKVLYDKLEIGHLDQLRAYITSKSTDFQKKAVHFVENHDEPRAASAFHGASRSNAAAVLSFTMPGTRLMFRGQEFGFKNKLDVHLRRSASESTNSTTEAFYDQLLTIIGHPVFHYGTWTYVPVTDDSQSWRMLAWRWSYGSDHRLVVVNYSDGNGAGRALLPDANQSEITELFSNVKYSRDVDEMKSKGLYVVLPAYSAQIFAY